MVEFRSEILFRVHWSWNIYSSHKLYWISQSLANTCEYCKQMGIALKALSCSQGQIHPPSIIQDQGSYLDAICICSKAWSPESGPVLQVWLCAWNQFLLPWKHPHNILLCNILFLPQQELWLNYCIVLCCGTRNQTLIAVQMKAVFIPIWCRLLVVM